jgi:hypothetical protein
VYFENAAVKRAVFEPGARFRLLDEAGELADFEIERDHEYHRS